MGDFDVSFSFYLGFAVASSSCDVVSRRRAIGFVSALVHRKRGHLTASEIAGESRIRQGRRREHEKVSLFPIKLANVFRKFSLLSRSIYSVTIRLLRLFLASLGMVQGFNWAKELISESLTKEAAACGRVKQLREALLHLPSIHSDLLLRQIVNWIGQSASKTVRYNLS